MGYVPAAFSTLAHRQILLFATIYMFLGRPLLCREKDERLSEWFDSSQRTLFQTGRNPN